MSSISDIIVKNLFPQTTAPKTIFDGLPKPKNDLLSSLLAKKQAGPAYKVNGDYSGKILPSEEVKYLQFPNAVVKNQVMKIVSPSDTDDQKAQKIIDWVKKNIKYVTDEKNYGKGEYWAKPTETLKRMSGDCEDGAFLIHSMLLNAGVPSSKVRTYGGLVEAGKNAPYGGHGWTAYKRSTDNKWITLDWCYYPTPVGADILKQKTFKQDKNYVDMFWYITAIGKRDGSNTWGFDGYV